VEEFGCVCSILVLNSIFFLLHFLRVSLTMVNLDRLYFFCYLFKGLFDNGEFGQVGLYIQGEDPCPINMKQISFGFFRNG